MKRLGSLCTALILSIGVVGPAYAVDTPRAGRDDPRVRTVNYNEDDVVRVVGVFRMATQIVFAPDEEIQNVALGDTLSWEVAPVGHIVFLKPREKNPETNLIITTRRPNGTVRSYAFELESRDGAMSADTPDTYYQIRFRYPADEAAARREAANAAAEKRRASEAGDQLDTALFYGPRNWAYSAEGSSNLEPDEISDNGQLTVLRFKGKRAVPAIYAVAADDTESLIPFDVRGELVVLHSVERRLRLRRGSEVLCIWNEDSPGPGVDPGTGTVSPGVVRTTKERP